MTKKLVVTDQRGERELLLVNGTVVGRDPACDISADDPLLSRRHAEFSVTGRQAFVRDLESRNGVTVNGRSTSGLTLLRDGDLVEIAALSIRFVDDVTPAPTEEDDASDDATIVLLPPAGATLVPRRSAQIEARNPKPVAGPTAPVGAQTVDLVLNRAAARAARRPARSFQIRLLPPLALLAVAMMALTMIPAMVWHSRVVRAASVAQAQALVNWLAADASANAAQMARGAGTIGAGVLREPAVVTAAVFTDDGRVLAPAARRGEVLQSVPGTSHPISALTMAQVVEHPGFTDGFAPVATGGSRRTMAWVRVGPVSTRTPLIVFVPTLLFALAASAAAAALIHRSASRAIARFNKDIDDAIEGQVESVTDPIGATAFRDLADTINYLIARTSVGAGRNVQRPVASWHAPRAAAKRDMPPSHEVRLIVDHEMRISEVASVACGNGPERPLRVAVERRGSDMVVVTLSSET